MEKTFRKEAPTHCKCQGRFLADLRTTPPQPPTAARKSAANAKKHGVSFEEAKSVFVDERAKLIDDPDHSQDEDRFVLLGLSSSLRLLVVCHCYRDESNIIRFISARKATTQESRFYP